MYVARKASSAVSIVLAAVCAMLSGADCSEARIGASKLLATVPQGYDIRKVVFAPHGSRVVYSAGKDGKWHLFDGDRRGREYDAVAMISLSGDGSKFAYSAVKGGRELCVVNGEVIAEHSTVCNPTFSPDGKQVVYEASESGRFFTVAGKHNSPRHDMSVIDPIITPDGKKAVTALQDYPLNKTIVYVTRLEDGSVKESGAYTQIGETVVSRDGWRVAHSATEAGRQHLVIIDLSGDTEKKSGGPCFDRVESPVFSPDGGYLAYVARENDRQFVAIARNDMSRQRTGRLLDEVLRPLFSPDGRYILYFARDKGAARWIRESVEGRKVAPQHDVDTASVSESSAERYMRDGKVVYCPDGSCFAFTGEKDGKPLIIVRNFDNPKGDFQSNVFDSIEMFSFSPDSKNLAIVGKRKNKFYTVLTDRIFSRESQFGPFEQVWSQVFNPDGTSIEFGVLKGRELRWVVEEVK